MHLVLVAICHHQRLHANLTLGQMSSEGMEAPLQPCNVQGQAEDPGAKVYLIFIIICSVWTSYSPSYYYYHIFYRDELKPILDISRSSSCVIVTR